MNDELLQDLQAAPDRLAAELEEMPESELVKRPEDGGWNLKEIAGHLRDLERVVALERLPRILQEDEPFLPRFDEEEAVRTSNAATAAIGESLAEWNNLRQQTVSLLRGLDADALARTGRHEERGPITPVDIANSLLSHDEQHYQQALQLKGMSREPSS